MVNTKEFKETIQKRALEDPEFRQGLLTESIESMLAGDIDTGKSLLRDYIKATVGFSALAKEVNQSPKAIMRMFSEDGNPNASKLFIIIHTLQKHEGINLKVKATR